MSFYSIFFCCCCWLLNECCNANFDIIRKSVICIELMSFRYYLPPPTICIVLIDKFRGPCPLPDIWLWNLFSFFLTMLSSHEFQNISHFRFCFFIKSFIFFFGSLSGTNTLSFSHSLSQSHTVFYFTLAALQNAEIFLFYLSLF